MKAVYLLDGKVTSIKPFYGQKSPKHDVGIHKVGKVLHNRRSEHIILRKALSKEDLIHILRFLQLQMPCVMRSPHIPQASDLRNIRQFIHSYSIFWKQL